MCKKCLYCYRPIEKGENDYHSSCSKKLFGTTPPPVIPYSRDNIADLALKVVQRSQTITGVQTKLSLDINRGGRNQPSRLTIVGLWGRYILKPESDQFIALPELEDVTMKLAEAAGIETAEHGLIRMSDGELAYITRRMDRGPKGEKHAMLDMCQLSNRLTEHKYRGTYVQLAETINKYSSAHLLDVQKFWKVVVFSWMTGNSDMHCKNFSLLERNGNLTLSPAYDLLAVQLTGINDPDELALPLLHDESGILSGYKRTDFVDAMTASGVSPTYAGKIIDQLVCCHERWLAIIDQSFLSAELRTKYKLLLANRIDRLKA